MKKGWEYKKLDDVCTIVGRIGFRGYTKADLVNSSKDGAITLSPSNIINGELDFSKCTYINWDKYYESPEIMLENGDIVLVKTASIGKCAVVKNLPHEATLNPQFVVLKHLVGVPDFICYYLKSSIAQNTIKQMAGGVAIPTLSQKKLGMMIVPTPSQDEQQSIVDYLDSAFAKIDAMKANAEKALNEAKALFQAPLKEMLEPKEGWEEMKVKELSLLITKGSSPKWQGNSYVNSDGILFVTSENVREGRLELNPKKFVDNSFNIKQRRSILKKFDVLVNIVGASIGRAAVFDLDVENANINQAVCLIRLDRDKMLPAYLCYFLNSEHAFKQYASMVKDTARANLSLENIGSLEIGIPPLSEQQSIVATLDSLKFKVDRLQANFEKISQECDALKQALLRQVFE